MNANNSLNQTVGDRPLLDALHSKYIDTHPQQNTFSFPCSDIRISSRFDSGNLARCTQPSKNLYHLYLSEDSLPHSPLSIGSQNYRTWFHFSVTGVPAGETLIFSVRNMNNQCRLFKQGLKPVYRVGGITERGEWKRIPNNVSYDYTEEAGGGPFFITFAHNFTEGETQTTYFAFSYPFSFEEIQRQTQEIVERFKDSDTIYAHKEVLGRSLEGRPMEILTFSGRAKMTYEREELIEGLFPEHPINSNGSSSGSERAFKFEKQTIFLTCRVHPGETPGQFVLNGIYKFLLDESNPQAKLLRDLFVFKIIPCLNPDGVYRGFYRLDTLNQNLNRYYLEPTQTEQPTIFAAKRAIVQQHNIGKLFIYVDLHAHANKRGCFMFGNALTGEAQLKNVLFPKLVSMNSVNFDYTECCFADKMMNCKDKKDGLSREGCGRVALYKATGNPHCYTLECNYASGKLKNTLAPMVIKSTGQIEPENGQITDINSEMYSDVTPLPYTIEIFEDVGRAFCIALLDYADKNPISRLPQSSYKTLDAVKQDLVNFHKILIPRKLLQQQSSSANSTKPGTFGKPSKKPSSSLPRPPQNGKEQPKPQIIFTSQKSEVVSAKPLILGMVPNPNPQQSFNVIEEKTEESSQEKSTGSSFQKVKEKEEEGKVKDNMNGLVLQKGQQRAHHQALWREKNECQIDDKDNQYFSMSTAQQQQSMIRGERTESSFSRGQQNSHLYVLDQSQLRILNGGSQSLIQGRQLVSNNTSGGIHYGMATIGQPSLPIHHPFSQSRPAYQLLENESGVSGQYVPSQKGVGIAFQNSLQAEPSPLNPQVNRSSQFRIARHQQENGNDTMYQLLPEIMPKAAVVNQFILKRINSNAYQGSMKAFSQKQQQQQISNQQLPLEPEKPPKAQSPFPPSNQKLKVRASGGSGPGSASLAPQMRIIISDKPNQQPIQQQRNTLEVQSGLNGMNSGQVSVERPQTRSAKSSKGRTRVQKMISSIKNKQHSRMIKKTGAAIQDEQNYALAAAE